MITYSWILALAAVTISLIYWELTAILYILATLGVTVLLVVVAMSDLAVGEIEAPTPDRAPSVGSGAVTQAVSGKSDWNARKRT